MCAPVQFNTMIACLIVGSNLAGAYSAAATGARTRQPDLAESDAADRLLNEAGSGIASDLESTDWPFDGMSCHTPVALQHREIERPAVSSTADMDAKRYSELVGDSAWETLRHEKHMERYSDSSGSTMTYDTSFIKHVGDRLFDTLAK